MVASPNHDIEKGNVVLRVVFIRSNLTAGNGLFQIGNPPGLHAFDEDARMLLNAHIQEHLQTGRLFATMDMRKYFKPVDKPAAVKPQKAAHATASSPSSNQKSRQTTSNHTTSSPQPRARNRDFFSSSSKIHQSEKTATTRMAKKSAAVTVNKEPSFAKPSDDDEFAEFDMDLSVDESALHKLMDS
ncbi:hypothetical protein BC830DRAFT_902772 [Chytriomyces sp. MP71]|nr:hypothetical protein BC830DRAFT_902772 [Chytriomyces sp. MP71]